MPMKSRRSRLQKVAPFALAAVVSTIAPFAFGQAKPAPGKAVPALAKAELAKDAAPLKAKIDIDRFTLDNGLRVVLNRDVSSPTVAVCVWYDVGSRNEKPGEGGFAHLFEHIMFEGSASLPRGVHDKIVEGRGGRLNASTSEDWTRYWELMPAGELDVTLFLEADRMKALQINEEAFENQRKVVQEEYRMRVDNAPYVKGYFRLLELVYEGYHPYAHPAIGSMSELDAAKLEWVKAFHDAYYAPNNAVLVVSGDFEVEAAKKLVHKNFDGVPKVAAVKKYDDAPFAGRTKASGPETVSDAFAQTPATMFGWSIPKDGDKEHYALEIAATVLSDGESSRLHKKLVKELGLAQDASAGTEDHRGPDAFVLDAHLSEKAAEKAGGLEEVEKILLAEIDEMAKKGPTADEMKKARAKIEHGFLFGLQSNLSRVMTLAKFEGQRGDAKLLDSEMERLLAVTPEDVKAAVAKYLKRETVAHVRVLPPPKEKKPEGEKKLEKAEPKKAEPKKETK